MKVRLLLFVVSISLVVSGCGGGGSTGSNLPPAVVATSFDVTAAGTAGGQGTQGLAIDLASGAIAGYYIDASGVYHGFCALQMTQSLRSMSRVQAQPPDRAHFPGALTQAPSPDSMLTATV